MKNTLSDLIAAYESAVARIILSATSSLAFPIGIKKTIELLRGSKSDFIVKNDLQSKPAYGILSPFGNEQLRTVIESLCRAGLMQVEILERSYDLPIVVMLPAGKSFLASNETRAFGFADALANRDLPSLDLSDKALYETLVMKRRELAFKRDVPAYIVCGQALLVDLVIKKPTTLDEMRAFKGVGDRFIDECASPFLEIIREHDPSKPFVHETESKLSNWLARHSDEYWKRIRNKIGEIWRPGDVLGCWKIVERPDQECQLCGHAPIRLNHYLTNGRTGQTLVVGSRCIVNYKIAVADLGHELDILYPDKLSGAASRLNAIQSGTAVVDEDRLRTEILTKWAHEIDELSSRAEGDEPAEDLAPEGMDPDEIDWEAFDFEQD